MDVSNTNEVEVEDAAAKRELEETSSDEDVNKAAVDKVPDDDEYSFDMEKYPVRELEVRFTGFKDPVSFNPVVSLIGVVCLWGLSIWCMVDPEGSNSQLQEWRSGVTLNFTWLFIGTRCAFLFFLIFVAYKWGHIKLGHKDEPPEFDTGSYFAMIFAAGVAVGLFVYGVAEPLSHRASHYYANSGYRSQDEIDMFAINMTVTNWGFGAWSVYLIVAVSMALAGFRFNLPMTFRSCFYPILGEYTWGWIGDCIDGFSIVVTVAGVCTSLGLGAIQIVAGFQFLGWVDSDASEDRLSNVQMLTIWGVTLIATASVVSGLQAGVKFLSQLAFGLGMLLTLIIFLMDNSKYLLNLLVQECGYFIQYSVFHLNFLTDAFGQLREGEGRAVDGKAAHESWQDWWPIFYQAWWVSWACFVGLFIARISRGRTVFEVILYSMIAPIAYCVLWFSVWGGIGLRQARQAEEMEVMGETYFGDKEEFKVPGSDVCFDVPQESLYNGTDTEPYFVNRLPGVTPVCKFGNALESGFNVLYSYSYPDDFETGYGPFLTVLFIFSLAIYFATSSDSGSLVVDHLASNGRKNHHWLQRVFWAFTEGAVATALLGSGGSDALAAVQAASIISGLPFVFFLVFIMQSITLMCVRADESDEMEYIKPAQPEFSVPVYGGIFNYGEYLCSLGSVNPKRIELGMDKPTNFHVAEFFKGVFLPFMPLQQVLQDTYPKNPMKNTLVTGLYATTYYAWIVLFIVQGSIPGVRVWAWVCFFIASFVLMIVRMSFRARFNIRSNIVGDFIAATIFWPQVFTQMRQHLVDYGNGSVIEGEVVEEDASGLKDVDA
mmetsp:Transcript_21987/g.41665  ORF Transcript_21987/g.41665 Transcript_21987/m.41665 type:complete len:827 (+) Transcript_21987:185-2665(+)